jgi:hypothetical protein
MFPVEEAMSFQHSGTDFQRVFMQLQVESQGCGARNIAGIRPQICIFADEMTREGKFEMQS